MAELDWLAGRDGVVSRGELIAVGIGDARIRGLVASDGLRRPRAGWFAAPHADPRVCRAARDLEAHRLGDLPVYFSRHLAQQS